MQKWVITMITNSQMSSINVELMATAIAWIASDCARWCGENFHSYELKLFGESQIRKNPSFDGVVIDVDTSRGAIASVVVRAGTFMEMFDVNDVSGVTSRLDAILLDVVSGVHGGYKDE